MGKTSLQGRQEEPGQERCEIWGREEELGQQKLMISVKLEHSGKVDFAVTLTYNSHVKPFPYFNQ